MGLRRMWAISPCPRGEREEEAPEEKAGLEMVMGGASSQPSSEPLEGR